MLNKMADRMDVGIAKIRGEEGAKIEVAVVKATLQEKVVPKEKHVITLKQASGSQASRQMVNYVIHLLGKRLTDNDRTSWLITLKALIVFHRLMREVDVSFEDELLRYCERTSTPRILRLESFADHSTRETWDYSAFVRVYSLYLDERVALFRTMRFEPDRDQQAGRRPQDSRLKSCSRTELLVYLPLAQRLLLRLVNCVPEGAAQMSPVTLFACQLVLVELPSVYRAVCEGILNLTDCFFDMDRNDALKGLDMYKENLLLNDRLNDFFGAINRLPALRSVVQFPDLQALPADFLQTLEEHVRDAPRVMDLPEKGTVAGAAATPSAALATPPAQTTGPRLVYSKDKPAQAPAPEPQPEQKPAPKAAVEAANLMDFLSLDAPVPAPPAPVAQAPAAASVPAPAASPLDFFNVWDVSAPAVSAPVLAVPQFSAPAAAPSNPFVDFALVPVAPKTATAPVTTVSSNPFAYSASVPVPAAAATGNNPFANFGASPPAAATAPIAASNPFASFGVAGSPTIAETGGASFFPAAPAAATSNPFASLSFPAAGAPAAVAGGFNPFLSPPVVVNAQQVSPSSAAGGASYALKKQSDPLNDLAIDLFGKPAEPVVGPSLRTLKKSTVI